MKQYKSISRIDSPRAHGWFVRVVFRRVVHAKFFSDGKHGGRAAALSMAVRWRNRTERSLGKPRTERMIGTKGAGVRRTIKEGRPVYIVTWHPRPGKMRRTSFSVRVYGERGARDLAHALRAGMERRYYGYP